MNDHQDDFLMHNFSSVYCTQQCVPSEVCSCIIDDNIGLDSYYKWLDEEVEKGPQLLSRKAKELRTRVLESADQDIQHKKDLIAKPVLKQVRKRI